MLISILGGERLHSWLRPYATRWVVPGSIPGRVLGSFQVDCSLRLHLVALVREIIPRNFLGGKTRPALRLYCRFVPNIGVRWKPNITPLPQSLHDLLWGSLFPYHC